MLIARHDIADTGNADIDRVCYGLRQTMSWLAEALERKALESVGQPVPRKPASASRPEPARKKR